MASGFHGGVHPTGNKDLTAHLKIEDLQAPKELVLPLSMHIGAPTIPTVQVGDTVLMGQQIGKPASAVSSALHAPVSGKIKAIENRLLPNGSKGSCIILENDETYTPDPSILTEPADTSALTREEILAKVREAGIVGLGGAAFPTDIKMGADPKTIDTVIINGAECEPYITADNRALREYPEIIIAGIKLIDQVLQPKRTVIGIEENKPHAIATVRELAKGIPSVQVAPLKVRYPQGAEKQLIKTLTGREVKPGGLPASVGCCVFNVSTAAQIYHACAENKPLTHKVVTVSGTAVNNPKNLRVAIGTPISALLEACGGLKEDAKKLIMGGPMMGNSVYSTSLPIVKGTNAILAFSEKDCPVVENPVCIRCGKCVSACPMNLQPIYLYAYERKKMTAELNKLNVMDCIECGCCSFGCPGRIPLVQAIRNGKALVREAQAAERRAANG